MIAWLRRHWLSALLLVLIGTAATWLRIDHIGDYSLWQDEAYTNLYVQVKWSSFLNVVRIDGEHPPVYYTLERFPVALFGNCESCLRGLSVLTGLAALLLAVWLGWQIGGPAGGLAAGWFWAFHPMTIWYSQDARHYSLLVLLSLIAVILFWKFSDSQSTGVTILAILVLALGLLTHYFFFLVYGALILLAFTRLPTAPLVFRRWTMLSLIAMIPLAAWLAWYFMLPQIALGIGWIQPPRLQDIPLILWNFLSGYGGRASVISTLFGILALTLVIVGITLGDPAKRNRRYLLIGLIVPLVLTWIISLRRSVYIDRFFIVLLPFLIFPISAGAAAIMHRLSDRSGRRWILVVGFILMGAVGLYNGWQVHADSKFQREDWKGLVAYLDKQQIGETGFWMTDEEIRVPFEYYYRTKYAQIEFELPPTCSPSCYWLLRQPYTTTHAFTQSLTDPERPWFPQLPIGCRLEDRWNSPTGIGLWKVSCD